MPIPVSYSVVFDVHSSSSGFVPYMSRPPLETLRFPLRLGAAALGQRLGTWSSRAMATGQNPKFRSPR